MVRRSESQGRCGWHGPLAATLAVAVILCLGGCPLLLTRTASHPPENQPYDLAAGVVVVAEPARRLLVTPDENQSSSRLLALWLRIENAGSEVLAFNPDEVVLTFADGTTTVAFDRERANALIELLDVAPTDEAAAQYPELWTIARRPGVQASLKRQLSDGLLTERALGQEGVEGFVLFDTPRRESTLDGALLQVTMIRNSDGTTLRQLYRFANAAPSAAQP